MQVTENNSSVSFKNAEAGSKTRSMIFDNFFTINNLQ